VTRLGFLSPSQAAAEVAVASPLGQAPAAGVTDVSHLGKLEVRGPLDRVLLAPGEELLRLRPDRGLLIVEGSPAGPLARLTSGGSRAYDMTAALAAFEFSGEDVLRRLTELDLAGLPAVGSIARGTRAVIQDRGAATFRLFVQQELGRYVVEIVLDTMRGLGR
jgi:hypothetical protein